MKNGDPQWQIFAIPSSQEYKNPSWVWGEDRKISPEDHQLASRGMPSDDSDPEGQIFATPSSQEYKNLSWVWG